MIKFSNEEVIAIKQTISNGKKFGFGNLICWLKTAWEKDLIEAGMDSEGAAIHSREWNGHSYDNELWDFINSLEPKS